MDSPPTYQSSEALVLEQASFPVQIQVGNELEAMLVLGSAKSILSRRTVVVYRSLVI
jgi:hypothetical protein